MIKKMMLLITIMGSLAMNGAAQSYSGERITAKQRLYIKDYWVNGFQRDSALVDSLKIPTSKAVHDFVKGRVAGLKTQVTKLSDTSFTICLNGECDTVLLVKAPGGGGSALSLQDVVTNNPSFTTSKQIYTGSTTLTIGELGRSLRIAPGYIDLSFPGQGGSYNYLGLASDKAGLFTDGPGANSTGVKTDTSGAVMYGAKNGVSWLYRYPKETPTTGQVLGSISNGTLGWITPSGTSSTPTLQEVLIQGNTASAPIILSEDGYPFQAFDVSGIDSYVKMGTGVDYNGQIVFKGQISANKQILKVNSDPAVDNCVVTLPQVAGMLATTQNSLNQFSSTTSTQLASVLSDETGTGTAVFSASPTFTGTVTIPTASVSTTVSGAGTWTAGAINTTSNVSGNNGLFSGLVRAGATFTIEWNGRSKMASPSDGAVEIKNNANTQFASIQTLYDRFGSGTPEAVITAPVGAVYHRTDGGAGTSFYVKESGTGNTGWVAK